MKRTMIPPSTHLPSKKPKLQIPQNHETLEIHDSISESQFTKLDENLLYEVFKHADAKTLVLASCVSKQWLHTAQDERLWERICTRHWTNTVNCGTRQLRSVVLALGGFRRLHSHYLSKTAAYSPPPPRTVFPTLSVTASGGSSSSAGRVVRGGGSKRWGKDEVNLSLSLLSIQYYEKMKSVKRDCNFDKI